MPSRRPAARRRHHRRRFFGDLELCANALGICDDACETAIRFAKTEEQGGQKLFAQQRIQLQINKMYGITEALRSFVLRVAWEHDNKIYSCNAGLAMNFSTDAVQEVTELYMEVRGADGCHMDHHPTSWCATPSSGAILPATACSA